jgi:endonuclease YncB( thermonuclease family)
VSNKATIRASLILFALILPASAQPQTTSGKVVGVSDGDTITVLDDQKRQRKIRLDGIDAPESSQDFGARAKQSLSDLVFGRIVTVASSKWDRYGRVLGKLMLSDMRDINLEQVERGMAWFYRQYPKELQPEDARADVELSGLQQSRGEEPRAVHDGGRSAGGRVSEGAELSLKNESK